jgi:hypothetical protein
MNHFNKSRAIYRRQNVHCCRSGSSPVIPSYNASAEKSYNARGTDICSNRWYLRSPHPLVNFTSDTLKSSAVYCKQNNVFLWIVLAFVFGKLFSYKTRLIVLTLSRRSRAVKTRRSRCWRRGPSSSATTTPPSPRSGRSVEPVSRC